MFGHIGVAMLVYYGNTLILNIRAEARNKKVQPLILKIAISFANAFFLVFSIVGYIAYRDETNSIFVMSFPMTRLTIFIRLCTILNTIVSYPF